MAGMPATRLTDYIQQTAPHCHAPIHPAALVPTAVPHPALPLALIGPGSPNVLINNLPAIRATDGSAPCALPACVPGGPGVVVKGSATVLINNLPAARVGDDTAHPACIAPIPSPAGKILPPGSPNVLIGG